MFTVTLLSVALAGCEQPGVRWLDDAPVSTSQPSPFETPVAAPVDTMLADSSQLAEFLLTQDLLREAGARDLVESHLDSMPAASETVPEATMRMNTTATPPAAMTPLGDDAEPIDSMRCSRSLRIATASGKGLVAVWWTRRSGGRVWLVSAWRDGMPGAEGAWRGPIVVDSLDQGPLDAQASDRGAVGCARPAPSLVVDDKHGWVHVAYSITGPEGSGVFYAHQMDPRSAFEPPRVIVYGDKLGAARVATSGDIVAVAYEDPNSGSRSRVSLALSRTNGHDFPERLTASAENASALDPWVAVRGRAVVVGWSDVADGSTPVFRIRRARIE